MAKQGLEASCFHPKPAALLLSELSAFIHSLLSSEQGLVSDSGDWRLEVTQGLNLAPPPTYNWWWKRGAKLGVTSISPSAPRKSSSYARLLAPCVAFFSGCHRLAAQPWGPLRGPHLPRDGPSISNGHMNPSLQPFFMEPVDSTPEATCLPPAAGLGGICCLPQGPATHQGIWVTLGISDIWGLILLCHRRLCWLVSWQLQDAYDSPGLYPLDARSSLVR